MFRSDKTVADYAVDWTEGENITRRHLHIRPTALGFGMAAVAAASWILALNYSVNIAYALAFWILSFAVWAMLQGILQLYGMGLRLQELSEVFAGDTAYATIAVQGQLRRRRLYMAFRQPESFVQYDLQFLDSRQGQSLNLPFQTDSRGIIPLPLLEIYTHAPFALLSVSVFLRPDWRITVYPAPQDAPFQAAGRAAASGENQIRQGFDDIAYLNDYQTGDSLKRVAWKQYAKRKKLLTKQTETSAGVAPDIISWRDYPEGTHRGNLASFLCARVLYAEDTHSPYVLELPNETIARQNGQRRKALTALSVL